MVRKIFKKHKDDQNQTKPKGRKQTIFATITLALSLLFGKPRSSYSYSSSPNFDNQTIFEKVQNFVEEDIQVVNTDGKVIETDSGILIVNSPISEGSKSALIIRSGDLSKSGPGARAKADARRNAKAGKYSSGSTIIPGANGFVPQQTYCHYHENAPLSCKPTVKVTDGPFQGNGDNNSPPPEDGKFDVIQYKGGSSPSMDKFANSLSPEYSEFQNKYYSESLPKRFDTNNYLTEEFKELAQDPRSSGNKFSRVSIDEARTIVQAKLEKLIIEPARPDMETAKCVDLDFIVQGPTPFTHIDVKNPVGSKILKKQGQTISLEDMSYRIGQKIVAQKQRFVGLENGPLSPENVGHIVDLSYVPLSEKAIVKQNILQGALDKGSDTGIIFLNDR